MESLQHLKSLDYYENKLKKIWTKDYLINFNHFGAKEYDDFFKLKSNRPHKVKAFKIW